jgi:hypothetical protein
MQMSDLFAYMKEIQSIDDGYALRFHRSGDLERLNELIGEIASYIIFESRNSPQLTVSIIEEPQAKAFWLQVRELQTERQTSSITSDLQVSSLV